MITDEKTQNKLYADTEDVLFTMDDNPKAVHKILEIIRDTPEYLQIMNCLPAHAQEDPKADWWRTKEADYLMADLLHVLEIYTPEGFVFGPVFRRLHGLGYGNIEYEKKRLYRIEIYLDWGYIFDKKDEYRKRKRHYAELESIFRVNGYTTELIARAKGCRISKGNTELYAHYCWLTGYCEATHLAGLLSLLLRECVRSNLSRCSILDSVYNFTDEEEYEFYQEKFESSIYYLVFDLFERTSWAVEKSLMKIASKIFVTTKKRPEDFNCNSPVYKYVLSAYQKLLDKGYLEEFTRKLGTDEFRCDKATTLGKSKNIFHGTQL